MTNYLSIFVLIWGWTVQAKTPEEEKRELEFQVDKIMQGEWILVTEKEEQFGKFKSTKQLDENTSLATMRLEATLNFPIVDTASVWFDNVALKKEWMDLCHDMRIIKRIVHAEDERTRFYSNIHQFIGTPVLFVKARTFVSQDFTTIDKQEKSIYTLSTAVKDPFTSYPDAIYSKKHILGNVIVSKSFMQQNKQDPKKTDLDLLVLVDPAGSIPHWIVNLVSSSWPEKTFYGMIEQIQKQQHKKVDFFEKTSNQN